ncbi:MAG: FtsH protease activity modulator HflK [Candidatus Omnitrophota bacterium]
MERKEQTILVALGANLLLIILRFILAGVSGSLGLKANAWHSVADVFVSGVVYLGLVISRKGNLKLAKVITKLERMVAIFVSLFIFYMGIELFSEAIKGEQVELKYLTLSAIGAFLGVIICYFMGRYKIYVGEQTSSPSLVADGYHSKIDMYCSISVLIGLVGSLFGMASLDKIAAMVVVVFIFLVAYEIFTSNLKALFSKQTLLEPLTHLHLEPHKKPKTVFMLSISSLFVIGYLFSGVYYVKWDEQGIVRRFGRIIQEKALPGLHYRLPYPFERIDLVKVGNIHKIETGSNLYLTGDTNLIDANIAIHYRISNAVQYLLKVNGPDKLIVTAATAGIRRILGERGIDYLLTTGKSEVELSLKQFLQKTLDENNSGVQITSLQLLEMAPPTDAIEAFQDVASAREDKVTYINEAESYRNTLVPEARGNAYKILREAEAYKEEKINFAQGDASLFLQRLQEYEKSKDITELRLYLESMERILPKVKKFLVSPDIKIESTDLWLLNEKLKGTGINLGGGR